MMDGRDDEKDPTYFLRWEFMILKVEDTLFRIPSFQLLKHSKYLRDRFQSGPTEGSNKEIYFAVDGGITATEFRHFLRIILPTVTEDLETTWGNKFKSPVSKDEWISALKISTSWHCSSVRNIAIDKLERPFAFVFPSSSHLEPMEKIVLGRKYYISGWVQAGYTELVKHGDLTEVEMEELGTVASSKLLKIMLDNTKKRLESSALDNRVTTAFQEELQSIALIEKMYSSEL